VCETGRAELYKLHGVKSGAAHYRPDLDGLRFVSILIVVFYHAGVAGFTGGYVGVDVFFVLSGYLITGVLIREQADAGRIDIAGFFARRIRRLLPLAALVLVTTLIVGGWLLAPVQRESLITDARWASLYAANWRFGRSAVTYSETEVTDSLLLHFWSLSIEEQFYFFWPLIVLGAFWVARKRTDVITGSALLIPAGLITVLSIGYSINQGRTLAGGAYFASFGRFWEMGVGALLAVLLPRVPRVAAAFRGPFLALGLGAILFAALTFSNSTVFPGYAALVPVIGTTLVVIAGEGRTAANIAQGHSRRSILSRGPLPALGRLSYGWYLWHWPLIGIALLARGRWDVPVSANAAVGAAVVASLALAWASHHTIENPIRHARPLRAAAAPNFGMGVALMLVPILGGLLFLRVGNVGDQVVAIPALASTAETEVQPSRENPPQPSASTGTAAGVAEGGVTTTVVPTTTLVPTTLLVQAMTPEQAAADAPGLDRPHIPNLCNVGIESFEAPSADECTLGDPEGDRTFVLLGDSHMQHHLPGLHLAAQDNGWRLLTWTKGGCPFNGADLWRASLSSAFVECAQWQQAVFDRLENVTADGVILGRASDQVTKIIDENDEIIDDVSIAAEAWSQGHGEVYGRLAEMFGEVVVIRSTPLVGHNAATCLSRNLGDPAQCAIDDVTNLVPDRVQFDAEVEAVGENHHYQLTPYLCSGVPCQVVTNGGVIKFRDSNHITGTFSTALTAVYADLIESMIEQF